VKLHRDIHPDSQCGGQVADGRQLFGTDHWCVYCGHKWSDGADRALVYEVDVTLTVSVSTADPDLAVRKARSAIVTGGSILRVDTFDDCATLVEEAS
jgi:hypothetical protein